MPTRNNSSLAASLHTSDRGVLSPRIRLYYQDWRNGIRSVYYTYDQSFSNNTPVGFWKISAKETLAAPGASIAAMSGEDGENWHYFINEDRKLQEEYHSGS